MAMQASSILGTSGVMKTVGPLEQGEVILVNSNLPLPMHTSSPIGALETSKPHQLGYEKQPSFEPLLSNSNEVIQGESNSQIPSTKRRRLRSDVWKEFSKEEDEVGKQRAICKYCHKGFDGSSKNGTTHFKNHFQRCKKVPSNVRDAQMIIPVERTKSVGEGNSSFDQDSNLDVERMIIKHQSLEPLTSDILRVYNKEKLKLLEHFDQLFCRFNLTLNLWVHKIEKISYCCYAVVFIDDNWKLKKKVVALKRLGHEFDPKIVHESFKGVLEDWNFDKKVCSLTIHGSSSSFEVVEEIIKTWLSYETSHPLGSFYISGDECMNDFLSGDFNMLQNVGKSTDGVAGTSNPCLVGIHDMYYRGLGQNGKKDGMNGDVNSSTLLNGEENTIEFFHRWCDSKEKVNIETSFKSEELHNYLQEPIVKAIEFDLLGWWSEQASSFTTLGRMARDILAIPVSSIISGSILSEKAMMDNPIFNGLDPKIIEAMICSRDWLESPKDYNISSVKEASMNTDSGKETKIWTEEEVKAYLLSPLTEIESSCLRQLQHYTMIGECVGGNNIKGQSLAPLLMIPPRDGCESILHIAKEKTLLINGLKTGSQVLKGFEKVDLKDVAKLFLPMCLHEHWIVLYADIDVKKLVWMDSYEHTRKSNDREKHAFQKWFIEFVLPSLGHDHKDWSFHVPNNIPSQNNSVDCALFVMKYADCLTHENYLPFTQDDVPHFRHRTLLDLYHGSTCLGMSQSY
ncbi:hypothetical protein V6N11_051175 [Hibiscus sabdariffa]|uniref:Uncharacterized protein n=1 Tax=Hibiscus sabdariffa TaxID=183260 RepID=A0ABR2R326_9ROSI